MSSSSTRIPVLLPLAACLLAGAAAASTGRAGGDPSTLAADLEGGWVGLAVETPEGPSQFALLFERGADGGLHARTHRDRETFVDLRLVPGDGGSWTLVETAGLAGLGVQSRTLVPIESPPGVVRFDTPDEPGFLVVDFALDGDRLALDVRLEGEAHASFRLQRLPDEALPGLRTQLDRLAEREPGGDLEAAVPTAPLEPAAPLAPEARLEAARAEVAARPQDARARLELGRAALAVLAEHPMRGMFLGRECVEALTRATELDPALAEPHRLLALYRLNAPAIGGGSKKKALRSAERFAELDAERGPAFLAEVERVVASR